MRVCRQFMCECVCVCVCVCAGLCVCVCELGYIQVTRSGSKEISGLLSHLIHRSYEPLWAPHWYPSYCVCVCVRVCVTLYCPYSQLVVVQRILWQQMVGLHKSWILGSVEVVSMFSYITTPTNLHCSFCFPPILWLVSLSGPFHRNKNGDVVWCVSHTQLANMWMLRQYFQFNSGAENVPPI